MSTNAIQGCVEGAQVRIRVTGSANFAVSQVTLDYCTRALAAGATHCRFELGACLSMDSTFIGGMTMLALRKHAPDGSVEIANTSEKVRRQITSLGIGSLFTFLRQPEAPGDWRPLDSPGPSPNDIGRLSRTMLDAHWALGQANPENVERFEDVTNELRRKQPPSEDTGDQNEDGE